MKHIYIWKKLERLNTALDSSPRLDPVGDLRIPPDTWVWIDINQEIDRQISVQISQESILIAILSFTSNTKNFNRPHQSIRVSLHFLSPPNTSMILHTQHKAMQKPWQLHDVRSRSHQWEEKYRTMRRWGNQQRCGFQPLQEGPAQRESLESSD